jgi:hypothetical protein
MVATCIHIDTYIIIAALMSHNIVLLPLDRDKIVTHVLEISHLTFTCSENHFDQYIITTLFIQDNKQDMTICLIYCFGISTEIVRTSLCLSRVTAETQSAQTLIQMHLQNQNFQIDQTQFQNQKPRLELELGSPVCSCGPIA